MTIIVTHSKVSTIPDGDDTSVVRPSDWNDDHVLVGLGTAAELDAGVPNGVATLDSGGKVPTSELPAAILGALSYQGTWNASTNTPTLTSSVGTKGYYYVVSVAGSTNLNGITDWVVGDWAVFNGSIWQKIDNTDAVTSVNGQTGTVVLTQSDITGTVAIANGGTGQTTATAGFNALAPTQTGNTGKYLTTDGTNTSWATNSGGDVTGPASATDNAVARFDTTTGKLIQNSVTLIDDTGNASGILSQQFSNGSAVTLAAGKLWYDGATGAWNAGMGGGNITQQIGEELFVYGKASAAITDSPLQIVYHTGTVGASGVITFAPTIAGITDENAIIGVATESLALNAFGRVTAFGVVREITTNGSAFGETWADDDVIWYNPVTGNPTNVKPVAPNIKFQIGNVIKAGAGGSGSFQVALVQGTALGGTDSNVQLSSPTAAQLLTYSTTSGYWKNTSLASGTGISTSTNANGTLTVNNTGVTSAVAGTGISVSGSTGAVTVTNSAPDQTVVLTAGTGISTSGTYPNFTITNTAPSSGGTVTSVTGTAPVVSSGGNTPAISMAAATGSVNGYLTSTDWTTFNNKGSGTVTAVSVSSANGFAGTSSGGATPALTLTTSITGVLKGNATAISAATSGTDYSAGTSALGTGILKSTTTTGALTIAVAADFPTLNQNTSGTAAGLSATLAATSGGTGQSTYAVGDLLQGAATNTLAKLASVATGNALISGGVTTASSWGKIGLTTHVSGTLPVGNGGTGLTSYTANGIVYASGTSTLASDSGFQYIPANKYAAVNITSATAWSPNTSVSNFQIINSSATNNSTSLFLNQVVYGDSSAGGVKFGAVASASFSADFVIANRNAGTYQENMRVFYNGGVSIGNTTTPSAGGLRVSGLIYPQQATTAAAPAYVKGAIYFDTTLNKLRVGGATAWETITSV